ncbi:MAG: hypothetical protein CSA66_06055 [Proteobacteria bacterium]|nr:MAG: hypothetical protein CSA66_06055 [Pseudomonadota bacterium]
MAWARQSPVCAAALALCGAALGACGDADLLSPADASRLRDTDAPVPADAAPAPLEGFGLPVIAVSVAPERFAALERLTGEAEAIEIDVEVVYEGQRYRGVEMELHGGFARTVPKKSYRLKFDRGQQPVFPFADAAPARRQRRLVLQASWIDPTWLRQKLTFDALRASGALAPRTGHAVLYVNRALRGLYLVIERVDKQLLRRRGLDDEGNVYKAVDHRANWVAKADPLAGYEHKVNEGNPTDDLGALLATLTHTPREHAAFEAAVAPALSLSDFMTYQRVHSYAMNQDAFTKNYYLYHDLTAEAGTPLARFRVISWDADATWGQSWDGAALDPRSWPGRGAGPAFDAWHGRDGLSPALLGIPAYREVYLERYRRALSAGPLDAATLDAQVVALAERLGPAARADAARWGRGADFDAEIARLREAIAARHDVMSARVEALAR